MTAKKNLIRCLPRQRRVRTKNSVHGGVSHDLADDHGSIPRYVIYLSILISLNKGKGFQKGKGKENPRGRSAATNGKGLEGGGIAFCKGKKTPQQTNQNEITIFDWIDSDLNVRIDIMVTF